VDFQAAAPQGRAQKAAYMVHTLGDIKKAGQKLLQQPHARHSSPILEGLLSRYRLARGAFESRRRSFVLVSFAWLRWCAYGAPARLADSTSWIYGFATTRWSVVTLDSEKEANEQLLLLIADTTIEGASPSHARQE
jgi:hypothetical protein